VEGLLELLELLRRELDAADARAEVGGRDPTDARLVFRDLPSGYRVVVVFDEPPPDRAATEARLGLILDTFAGVGDELAQAERPVLRSLATRRLHDALAALASRTSATAALVIDDSSPVVWGSSIPELQETDVGGAIAAAGTIPGPWGDSDASSEAWRRHPLAARAVAHLLDTLGGDPEADRRKAHHGDGPRYLARGFGIYLLLLVFDAEFSELSAEGEMIRALPTIEHLVLSLPPMDPPRRGGRVIPLRQSPPE